MGCTYSTQAMSSRESSEAAFSFMLTCAVICGDVITFLQAQSWTWTVVAAACPPRSPNHANHQHRHHCHQRKRIHIRRRGKHAHHNTTTHHTTFHRTANHFIVPNPTIYIPSSRPPLPHLRVMYSLLLSFLLLLPPSPSCNTFISLPCLVANSYKYALTIRKHMCATVYRS